jgi:photosystem II stability/assembly factor-like uncharacterized protein
MPARALRPLLSILLSVSAVLAVSRPVSAAGRWTSIGPYGGTVLSLALQPADSDVLYAGSILGVFKSVDRGAHWAPAGRPFGPVVDLAVDPSSPSTVYAATTGALFRSTDGGTTWQALGGIEGAPHALAITGSGTVYAGTESGMFASTDGGATWQARNDGLPSFRPIAAIAIDPARPETLYAGLLFGGVYTSEDGGAQWHKASVAIPDQERLTGLEIAPAAGGLLYASTLHGIFRSQDGGVTWQPPQSPVEAWSLAVHRSLPDVIWAGTREGVRLSRDGGATWQATASPSDFVTKLKADPDRSEAAWAVTTGVSGQGGVFQSVDAGAHWTSRNRGLAATDVPALAITQQAVPTLYASTGYVVQRSRNRGLDWTLLPLRAGVIRDVAVDPIDPTTVYALGDSGLFQSTDRGNTWSTLWSFHLHGDHRLRIDPRNPSLLYAAVQGLYKSTDRGRHWTRLKLPVPALFVDPLVIAPSAPQTLYALAWTQPEIGGPLQPHLLRSRNRGKTWTVIRPGAEVQAFAVDPRDSRMVYAFTDDGTFRTTDGGDRWTLTNNTIRFVWPSNPPSLIALPGTPPVLVLAYARTVLKSTDSGVTWLPMKEGLTGFYETGLLTPDPRKPGKLYLGLTFHGLVTFEP